LNLEDFQVVGTSLDWARRFMVPGASSRHTPSERTPEFHLSFSEMNSVQPLTKEPIGSLFLFQGARNLCFSHGFHPYQSRQQELRWPASNMARRAAARVPRSLLGPTAQIAARLQSGE
jgi:hypothetical protein